jgi:gamma-glutamyltranspeptidase/glutathione hydrolase
MLEPYHIEALNPDGAVAAHLITQASRLAFADRNKFMADGDFVNIPVNGLLDKEYLRSRSKLINPVFDMGTAAPGNPPTSGPEAKAASVGLVEHGTSHLAIVDLDGNAVSMTMSVERSFGARITAGGFILNNQLTDFSFVPSYAGKPVANRPEAGKRPRSSMSPTLVLNADGTLFAAVGSPGGSRIIGYTVQALLGLIDWQMPAQAAISLRHVINRNDKTEIEEVGAGSDLEGTLKQFGKLAAPLADLGHDVQVRELNSGLQGIRVHPDGTMDGGADPRREGVVIEVRPAS